MSQKLLATFKLANSSILHLWEEKNILDITITLLPYFWRERIRDDNLPFYTSFFKLRSWWSWRVLINFIHWFTFTFFKTKSFCVFRRYSAGIIWDISAY